jgi:hypothetical protein
MEQTAVEWFIEKFKDLEADFKYSVIDYETYKSKQINLLDQAKEMEKEQRSQANNGNYCAVCGSTEFWYDEELDSSIVDDDNNEYDDD